MERPRACKLRGFPGFARNETVWPRARIRNGRDRGRGVVQVRQTHTLRAVKSSTLMQIGRWLPVVAWMCVIFFASTDALSGAHTSRFVEPFLRWLVPDITAAGIERAHFAIRKLGHLTEYAILAALLWRVLPGAPGRRALMAIAVCAVYAASDEFHQSFIPSRGASPVDVMIDTAGSSIAAVSAWLLVRKRASANAPETKIWA